MIKMAHQYNITQLIDCCTNLFALFFHGETKEEIENLKKLALLYNNEHLKQLVEHLLNQFNRRENK